MATKITQSQYDTTKQTIRNQHIKLNIVDNQFMVLDSIEGVAISGNIENSATTDIRRSCNLSFVVTNSSLDVQAGGAIFLDKYVQVFVGIDDYKTGEIAWTNMGFYMINQPSYNYDAQTHTLSLNGLDLMAKLTGQRNGYIMGLASEDITLIKTGQNVREVIIGILETNGFTRYVVSECQNVDGYIQPVPYDMEFGQGSTWYDVLCKVRNILPQYQIFFDVDGVFHYELIPSTDAEPIMIDESIWAENVISESVEVDFESVKNFVEVYGVVHEPQHYATTVDIDGNKLVLNVPSLQDKQEVKDYLAVVEEAEELGVDLSVTQYGNIDLNNRQTITWTQENLDKYASIIAEWGASTSPFTPVKDDINNTLCFVSSFGAGSVGFALAASRLLQNEDGDEPILLPHNVMISYLRSLAQESTTSNQVREKDMVGMSVTDSQTGDEYFVKQVIAYAENFSAETLAEATALSPKLEYVGSSGKVSRAKIVAKEAIYEEYFIYGFILNNDQPIVDPVISLDGIDFYPTTYGGSEVVTIPLPAYDNGEYYCVQFSNDEFLWMGHAQAQGSYRDINPESPFYVYGSVGEIGIPLYGGDYENIQTDYLAEQRAKYEIYVRCRLNDTLRLTTVPIYWGDVNWKVNYKPLGQEEVYQYMVQSIHTDLSEQGNQTWELSRFYPFYPVIS